MNEDCVFIQVCGVREPVSCPDHTLARYGDDIPMVSAFFCLNKATIVLQSICDVRGPLYSCGSSKSRARGSQLLAGGDAESSAKKKGGDP